ncbi:MAG: permease [Candidatus Ratteibacteria bacterium]
MFLKLINSILFYVKEVFPALIVGFLLSGILLASFIDSFFPISYFIKNYLSGNKGYIFAVFVGILMYMCATMSVPIVHSLIKNGMSIGPAFSFLMIGPITSYGTLILLRKEFGIKVLLIYLLIIILSGVSFGYIFSILTI